MVVEVVVARAVVVVVAVFDGFVRTFVPWLKLLVEGCVVGSEEVVLVAVDAELESHCFAVASFVVAVVTFHILLVVSVVAVAVVVVVVAAVVAVVVAAVVVVVVAVVVVVVVVVVAVVVVVVVSRFQFVVNLDVDDNFDFVLKFVVVNFVVVVVFVALK